ncbi:MAG TPA: methyl-accepting chemotaxis protein [Steroidobacteraceae bacterium]|jgi:methyl-accepting chemotaxis protein
MSETGYGSDAAAEAAAGMSLKGMLLIMLIGIAVAMGALALGIQRLGAATDEVAKAHEIRYTSYLLADELRQSSDDLTRLARTYVVSRDPKWKEQYQEVLDIRAGKRPRPAQYYKIYWDFRAAGIDPQRGEESAIALTDLMKRAGFTAAEFEKLGESERNSNDLVHTETVAMNMVEGRFADANGNFTRQDKPDYAGAQAMMHDLNYHLFKSKIMKPLDEFFNAVDLRTQQSIKSAEQNKKFWHVMLVAIATVLMVLLFGSLWIAYRQLAQSLRNAVRISDAIASGNLDVDVQIKGPREVASLLRAMSAMRSQLVSVVANVRQNAESVASACGHIAQGNSDLSARTEEQASALQQSATSMEELNTTVQRNADNAAQADRLSSGAKLVATRGGEVVGRVVDTMKGITESSKRIADIIGVIDSIAFQTNLLALNAAVEAARAGEQGRGFAVVAAEVRQLAQRSAEAAKQIRTLILDSVDRVEKGTALVDQAGSTMTEMVAAIQRVTDIMGEISVASAAQSAGVKQVSQSVAQMDEATQQNAALVEESAAAAEMLRDQARQLVEAVAVFKMTHVSSQRSSARASASSAGFASGVNAAMPAASLDAAA